MSWLVALPIAIPLGSAVLALLGRRSAAWARIVSLAGVVALLGAGVALLAAVDRHGHLVMHVGHWRAPFGIALVADRFAALMVVLSAAAGLWSMLFALREETGDPPRPMLLPIMSVLLMGVCGAFLTGDLFNLYVWFEVLLMASFVLLALGNRREQLVGAVKYVVLNLLSSLAFLAAAGLVYGMYGTLNFADLARLSGEAVGGPTGPTRAIAGLLLLAFGIKAALVPVFFWLPASYHTPSFAVSALFSALLTKVGMYSIIRAFTVAFPMEAAELRDVLAVLAGVSMVVGVLGAASQYQVRRILAFHSVSQMGYILMGLAIGTPAGLAASVFFVLHHGVVKSNLFLVAGAMERATGSNYLKDHAIAGLLRASPMLAGAFLVTALSLAGIPPMSGFAAKLGLIAAGVDERSYWLVGVATGVGLLTMYSMVKIWAEAFWREPDESSESLGAARRIPRLGLMGAVPLAMAGLTLALGVLAGPVVSLCVRAGEQLADPSGYVRAVLPGTAGVGDGSAAADGAGEGKKEARP